ncbi:glycoside hydrolase family 3 protein [Collybiopsis luxurians FD-317 M1]|uniref:beta-glucosidase n=1 Tax=Collybiopsis luxurians FD-317 M1 TaxID=944289 RepID=A0A0D0CCB6_9AGAR|nr:glycoside hydrolase family 3 protein [Collybiopsis luxurians FD-317 M1]
MLQTAFLILLVLGATAAPSDSTDQTLDSPSFFPPSAPSLRSTPSYNETAILSSGYLDLGEWQDAYNQASAFVSTLTNEEKVLLITRQDIPDKFTALNILDSTVAPNTYYFVSTFPGSEALAMTWDKDLIYNVGHAIGSEHYNLGLNALNGPVTTPMGRSPWGGRNDKSLGPDAYLNGAGFGRMVAGISSSGSITIGQHIILYEQETNRTGGVTTFVPNTPLTGSYKVVVDDKAFHETYLRPWYDGVKNGLGGAMCAMNAFNGTRSCENAELMNNYLKTEIGFLASYSEMSSYNAAISGMDYSATTYWSNDTILAGINNGSISQARLDDMAVRGIMAWYKHGQNSGTPTYVSFTAYSNVRANHSAIIRDAAAKSIVLLKNNGVLPLGDDTSTMVLFGAHAGSALGGPNFQFSVLGSNDTYQGHLAAAGGSGTGSMSYIITPHHVLTNVAEKNGIMLFWIMNNTWTSEEINGGVGSFAFYTSSTVAPITYASYAGQAEVSIVFINAWSGEGADRSELRNDEQDELVATVAANCNNTIVVVNTVGPRILDAWIDHENVTAVLYAGMLGQQSGNSIVDVLYGRNISPRYEFGYGLSYTTFAYGEFSVQKQSDLAPGFFTGAHAVGGRADLWDEAATVTFTITNTGTVAGTEIAQLYMTYPSVAEQPIRQLRGFEKVAIEPGESETVTLRLLKRDFAFWNVTVTVARSFLRYKLLIIVFKSCVFSIQGISVTLAWSKIAMTFMIVG